jgi:hypothetical protein
MDRESFSTATTDCVPRCLTKSILVVDPQPKSSLIISPNLRRLITSLVEKYGNAIIALQLAAMVNALKVEISAVSQCISPTPKTGQMLHHSFVMKLARP